VALVAAPPLDALVDPIILNVANYPSHQFSDTD
jgi:hypothetical protein